MLNEAFESLKEYDWGTDRAPLAPIDDAVAASHGDETARKDIESQLLKWLASDISRDAKDYICRKLSLVGSATSVAPLSKLLGLENHSHMARFAMERIPSPDATKALADAVASSISSVLKVGVISSIGTRRDASSVAALASVLGSSDALVAKAAARALGQIGTTEAATALGNAKASPEIFDAQFTCAESLLANNKIEDAMKIYRSLSLDDRAKMVRLAATRGMLACKAKATT